ncbi:MAG: hypothetical protein DRJ01_14835, partial [Bacteroidetes bacterium]
MKKMTITIVVMLLIFGSIFAQTPKAEDILKKVDAVVNAPQDQEILLKMILTDKAGNEKIRE